MTTAPAMTRGAVTIRPFAGERLMACRMELGGGQSFPPHSHEHEQLVLVESGRLRLTIGERAPFELGPGHLAHCPPNVPHAVEILEEAVFWDVFTPLREDLLARLAAQEDSPDD